MASEGDRPQRPFRRPTMPPAQALVGVVRAYAAIKKFMSEHPAMGAVDLRTVALALKNDGMPTEQAVETAKAMFSMVALRTGAEILPESIGLSALASVFEQKP